MNMTPAQAAEYQKGVDLVNAVAAKIEKRGAKKPSLRRGGRNGKANATHRVHIGYTASGRSRYAYFPLLSEAQAACNAVFAETGIVLSIEAMPDRTTTTVYLSELPHGGTAPEPNWPDYPEVAPLTAEAR